MATKTNKISKKLYNDTIELTFYPDSHRYKLAGDKNYLISVTSITGLIDKSRQLMKWATDLASKHLIAKVEQSEPITHEEILFACNLYNSERDEAASIGQIVHRYAEEYALAKIKGEELPDPPEDAPEPALNGINAFLAWNLQNNVVYLDAERLLYSKEHGYAGLTDIIALVNGKKYIGDYKTSKDIYEEHVFQISGYWKVYEEETGEVLDGALILHFNKETGEFSVVTIEREDHEKNFTAFLGLYEARKRLKVMRANSYSQK